MAKLKSGTRIYGTATIDTSVVVGSAVTLSSSGVNVSGVVTSTTLNSTVATLTNAGGTNLNFSGIGTFSNGPILVGSATSTGTASQRLQVTGSAYVSGRLGVGNTNPSYDVDVTGSVGITTTSGDVLTLSSTLSNGRTSIVLNTNGNDWELGSRGSSASPINSFYIYDRNASAYRQVIDPSGNVLLGGATAATGTASQPLQVTGGAYVSGNLGVGTTNPTENLSVLGKIQINQDSSSNNRLIFRGQPSSSYRWNIDNYGSSNEFRIFREDDATSANGSVAVSISTTGTVTATKFSGDGSLLTGITAAGSGVVVQNQDSTVGTANTLNFSTNLTASFASGTATISLSNNPSISGILTADQVYTSNNGNGTNVRIGDDFWVGDINVANTTRFSGAQDSTKAFVVFGSSDAVALGRTGTGPLYYGGNFNVAGVSSATSFSGSGTNLSGIVTSIVAGTNITVSGSTGQVTINSTATGGGAALDILEVMLFA